MFALIWKCAHPSFVFIPTCSKRRAVVLKYFLSPRRMVTAQIEGLGTGEWDHCSISLIIKREREREIPGKIRHRRNFRWKCPHLRDGRDRRGGGAPVGARSHARRARLPEESASRRRRPVSPCECSRARSRGRGRDRGRKNSVLERDGGPSERKGPSPTSFISPLDGAATPTDIIMGELEIIGTSPFFTHSLN